MSSQVVMAPKRQSLATLATVLPLMVLTVTASVLLSLMMDGGVAAHDLGLPAPH
jgi:hypothetical protein